MSPLLRVLVLLALPACGDDDACPAGYTRRDGRCLAPVGDAGADAATDAAIDAGADAAIDAGADAATDAGCHGALDELDEDEDGTPACDDCDDHDEARHPGAVEACNGVDDDCTDGVPADESDGDGDDFRICDGDCADDDGARHPGAAEVCNGLDDDCAGGVPADEADGDVDTYRICEGDCADDDETRHPGAAEACNGLDDDCAGGVPADEVDADGDEYRLCDDDCADDEPDVHPDQTDYFEEPYGAGSWDYDCDGEETMRRTSVGCGPPDIAGNCGPDYWCNSVPLCGERQYRVASCISCNPSCDATDDVQTCR